MTIKFPATVGLKIGSEYEKFEVDFSICENPDCDCNGVNMVLYNENNEINFFLDFTTEAYTENNYTEREITIIKAFIEFLISAENNSLNFSFFKRNYQFIKERVKCRRDTLESFNIGSFLSYKDMLWKDKDINMNINGKDYLILDGYCVNSDCTCTEVALYFLEDVYKLGVRNPDFSFVYDYITGMYRGLEGINDQKVKHVISTISESENKKFKERHLKLKKYVEREVQKKIEDKGFITNERRKRKLGRNDPCYCGSGKKYKKCCLDKEI